MKNKVLSTMFLTLSYLTYTHKLIITKGLAHNNFVQILINLGLKERHIVGNYENAIAG